MTQLHNLEQITPFLGYLTGLIFIGFFIVLLWPLPDRVKLMRAIELLLATLYSNLLHRICVCVLSWCLPPQKTVLQYLNSMTHSLSLVVSIGLVIVIHIIHHLAKKALKRWTTSISSSWGSGVFWYKKHAEACFPYYLVQNTLARCSFRTSANGFSRNLPLPHCPTTSPLALMINPNEVSNHWFVLCRQSIDHCFTELTSAFPLPPRL